MPGKLTDEQNERVRAIALGIVRKNGDNISAVARMLHKDYSWLHRFIKGQVGASFETAELIAKYGEERVVDVLGIAERPVVTWSELPGFDEAYKQARATAGGRFSEEVWDSVKRFSMPPNPPQVEPWMLLQVAGLVESINSKQLAPPPPALLPKAVGQKASTSRMRIPKRR